MTLQVQVPQQFGTAAIQRFMSRILDLAKLDRNQDGNISTDEWGQAVFGLLPELLNIKELTNEVRDLDTKEVADLLGFASDNFPDYAGLQDEKEEVIRKAFNLLSNLTNDTYDLLWAIKAMNAAKNVDPVIVDEVVLPAKAKGAKPTKAGTLPKQPETELPLADSTPADETAPTE
jgi:hypothetical protein